MKKEVKRGLYPCVCFLLIMSFFTLCGTLAANEDIFEIQTVGDNCIIVQCDASVSGELVIPETISGKPVTGIDEKAFYGCNELTRVVLPKTVVEIGDEAFSCCTKLSEVIMGDSVEKIGSAAFSKCYALSSITLSSQLISVSREMFYLCKNLSQITFSDEITTFGENAFYGCSSLKTVVAPEKLTDIFVRCFSGCSGLERIYLPSSVESIHEDAFEKCDALTCVYFEGSEADFADVSIATGNACLTNAEFVFEHSHPSSASAFRVEASCTQKGYTKYDCDCGYESIGDILLPEGHELTMTETVKAPTCKSEGIAHLRCENCSYYVKTTLPLTSHIEKTDKAVKATCTKSGKTKGSHCSVCSETIIKQKTVPSLKHDFSKKIKDKAYLASKATYTKAAKYYYTCTRCGEVSTDKTFSGNKLSLDKVSKISFTSTDNSVTLKWSEVKNARGYAVYRKTSDGKWKLIKRVRTNRFEIDDLASGRIYTYAVKAYVLENGTLVYAENYTSVKTATKPSVTSKITVAQNKSSVMLNWSAVKGATGYRVYRYDTKKKKWIIIKSKTESCKLTVKNLKSGYRYKFAVRAYIDTGKTVVWGKKYKSIVTCTKPESPVIKASSYKYSVMLEWDKIKLADGYTVYCSENPNSGYKKIAGTKSLAYKIDGLESGKTYYFKVYAYRKLSDKNVYSYASDIKKVKTR